MRSVAYEEDWLASLQLDAIGLPFVYPAKRPLPNEFIEQVPRYVLNTTFAFLNDKLFLCFGESDGFSTMFGYRGRGFGVQEAHFGIGWSQNPRVKYWTTC